MKSDDYRAVSEGGEIDGKEVGSADFHKAADGAVGAAEVLAFGYLFIYHEVHITG